MSEPLPTQPGHDTGVETTSGRAAARRRLHWPRPRLVSALDPGAQPQLEELHGALGRYYNSAIAQAYFAMVDDRNAAWSDTRGAHHHLHASIPAGARVLDLGCGTDWTARQLADRDVRYTGVEWSNARAEQNALNYPEAEFIASSLYDVDVGGREFDVVMSLYVIEHLVWPFRLLETMHARAVEGGLIALLTPPFRHGKYLKSFRYGLSARPFPDKVRAFRWIDAALHLYHHRVVYPLELARRFPPGQAESRFLINLDPVCLDGVCFSDADAVYLADTSEAEQYLAALGAETVNHRPEDGYLLMRKLPR